MELFALCLLVGLIPAAIARSKGRSFFLWWIYGAALFIVALPNILLLKSKQKTLDRRALQNGMKKCPRCAELIRREALVCRHCGFEFAAAS